MLKLPEDDLGPGETALACSAVPAHFLDRPRQIRFDRRGLLVDVCSVKAESGFKAKRIARAKSDRRNVSICEQFLRNLASHGGRG
jgi:hypothetical protein